ncbi:MAG: hypothetical protein ACFCBW_11130 [Candidatus Competibacterales bacterium]
MLSRVERPSPRPVRWAPWSLGVFPGALAAPGVALAHEATTPAAGDVAWLATSLAATLALEPLSPLGQGFDVFPGHPQILGPA